MQRVCLQRKMSCRQVSVDLFAIVGLVQVVLKATCFIRKLHATFDAFPTHYPSTNDFSFDLSGSSGLRRILTLALIPVHPTIFAKDPRSWKQQKENHRS